MQIKNALEIKVGDMLRDKTTGEVFTVTKIKRQGVRYGHKKPDLISFRDQKRVWHWHRRCLLERQGVINEV